MHIVHGIRPSRREFFVYHAQAAARFTGQENDMAINMEYLSHFIVAAEYLNFTMAAERLFMSQSTLSRQIKDLEDECGVSLFIRNGRSVALTKAGQTLYEAGRPLLAHLDQVTDLISRSGAHADQRIQIYSVPAFFDVLTDVYRQMKARGIGVEFCIHHLQQQDPIALLETDAVDFLITYSPFLREDAKYVRIPFARESFCAVCSPTHPLAARESVTIDECLRENVLFGKEFPLLLRRGSSFIPHIETMEDNNLQLTLPSYYPLVCLNEGILILPVSSARSFVSGLRYIPISDPELVHDVILVYRKSRYLSPVSRVFVEELDRAKDLTSLPVTP